MKRYAFKPKSGKTWKKLRPINPRNKNRFVPASVLKDVKVRSGGICERMIFDEIERDGLMKYKNNPKVSDCFKWGVIGAAIEAGKLWRCNRNAMPQPHHIKKRSQGGKHTLENLIDLCFECHTWVEAHPKESELEGLNKPY